MVNKFYSSIVLFIGSVLVSDFINKLKNKLKNDKKNKFKILFHGGAGVIDRNSINGNIYYENLLEISQDCYSFINENENENKDIKPVDIAEYCVKLLENNELFNAGKGAVYTNAGNHELEASIMNGETLECGGVSLIKTIKNPISAARIVMEKSIHNLLVGNEVEKLCIKHNNNFELCENSYYDTEHRKKQLIKAQEAGKVILDHDSNINNKMGTVGCVVMYKGNISAATSTGGMTNKSCGRMGDSSIIGAGTYADNNTAAISCTGIGELFIKHVVAYSVCNRIKLLNDSLDNAAREIIFNILPNDSGGLIAVNSTGDFSMQFNTPGMFRGIFDSDGNASVGIWNELKKFNLK